jgi:hypothetical protein
MIPFISLSFRTSFFVPASMNDKGNACHGDLTRGGSVQKDHFHVITAICTDPFLFYTLGSADSS